jgi:hypothetical protein
MTTAAVPPPENDPPKKPSKDTPKKASPRRVGPVRCGACGSPATRHGAPPSLLALCDTCSTFDARYAGLALIALVASTPSLIPMAFLATMILVTAAFVLPVLSDFDSRKSPPPYRRSVTR